MTLKKYSGNAAATALNGAIGTSGATIETAAATGWPTTGPYVMCIDRGLASEEKILIASRSGTTHTVSSRGYDGTSAVSHADDAVVEHVLDAVTLTESSNHINLTSQDDHTQYLNNARHDVTARHAFGSALGTPAAPAAVATTAAAGTGAAPAREDHVHTLADAVVTEAKLATDAVTTVKVAAAAITEAEIAASIAGNGLAGGAGTALSVNVDNSTVELNTDALRVKAAGITEAHLAASIAGAGLAGGAGTALSVGADNSTIEVVSDVVRVKDAGITQAKLAATPSASIRKTGTQVITNNTWTAIETFGTTEWDFTTTMLGVASKITIPAGWGGKYLVSGEMTWTYDADLLGYAMGFSVNSDVTPAYKGAATSYYASSLYTPQSQYSLILNLAAGDVVRLWAYHLSSTGPNTVTDARFQVDFLKP